VVLAQTVRQVLLVVRALLIQEAVVAGAVQILAVVLPLLAVKAVLA
jgi:hypothetical protein